MQSVARSNAMPKLDFRDVFSHLYDAPERNVEVVTVPRMHFLACCGTDDPFTSERFQRMESVLRRFAANLQSTFRESEILDYRPMPLECLWAESEATVPGVDGHWKWMMMIMQPVAKQHIFETEREGLGDLAECRDVQLLTFCEGQAVQTLHTGKPGDEARSRRRLDQFIEAQGYRKQGHGHTIYLTDPLSGDKTVRAVVRQPIASDPV